ncbi:MAG: Rnf-Nqr domain containing protein, partial [Verrucomicrobiota bacterium]
ASRHSPLPSLVDGFATGAGFAAVLVLLGSVREVVGHGTLLRDADLIFGAGADEWMMQVPAYDGFLLALLPPGAFFALALAIAARNVISARSETSESRTSPAPANG